MVVGGWGSVNASQGIGLWRHFNLFQYHGQRLKNLLRETPVSTYGILVLVRNTRPQSAIR
jgi:hypothetical protein